MAGKKLATQKRSATNMLCVRLQSEHDIARRNLKGELVNLRMRIERALKAVDSGERVDAHLIANAGAITGEIWRWNLVIDLLPLTKEEPTDEG